MGHLLCDIGGHGAQYPNVLWGFTAWMRVRPDPPLLFYPSLTVSVTEHGLCSPRISASSRPEQIGQVRNVPPRYASVEHAYLV